MKKSFLMLGVAAMALASCTQNEVVEYAENRAIQFDAFVGKSTRAVTELETAGLTQFNVFAYHTGDVVDYNNVAVKGSGSGTGWKAEANAYWQAGNAYEFAAYSDQNAAISSGVSFADKTLTFTRYTVGEKDLVAAQTSVTGVTAQYSTPVDLTFYHMLSQVKFTFTNTDSRSYTLKISEIKIENAVKTATGTYTESSIDWVGNASDTYTFADIADIAEDGTHAVDLFVIPQPNSSLNVSFKASFYDDAALTAQTPLKEGTFTASLNYTGSKQDTETGKWTPGFRYNYTAEVNAGDIDDQGKLTEIVFKVTDVDTWDDADESTISPVQPQP